tara:strand:+ start:242 stop:1075 length:834 start_codon:yes stop_codon:yes gene_type:complete
MEKPTILLVDDEPNILSSLKRLLRRENWNILTANSGKEGLEILKKNEVALIISDQRMPEMTGVEFLRQVKELYPDTIRIILSGYTEVNSIVSAINEGEVYKFITKPWNDQEIKLSVKRAIHQHELLNDNKKLYRENQKQNAQLSDMTINLEKIVEERTRDLQISEKYLQIYQNIVENFPMGIVGIDDERNIVMGNLKAHEALELKPGTMVGQHISKVFLEEVCEIIKGSIQSKERRKIAEYKHKGVMGEQIFTITCYPIIYKAEEGGTILLLKEIPS